MSTSEATSKDVHAMLAAVNVEKPKPEAVKAYRQWLADNPGAWRRVGDMAQLAQDKMIDVLAAPAIIKEGLQAGMAALRTDLGHETAPMLERLLIEQVIVCWLQMYTTQYSFSGSMVGSVTLNQGDYWERRLTSAQARYLRAMETLARVRRLARVTPLQVNIGVQQVNVAGEIPQETANPR